MTVSKQSMKKPSAYIRRVVRAFLVLVTVIALQPGFASARHQPSTQRTHIDPQPSLSENAYPVAAESTGWISGRVLHADLHVDEEFIAMVGSGWPMEIDAIVQQVNAVLNQAGLDLQVRSIRAGSTNDNVDDIRILLRSLTSYIQPEPGLFNVLVICQDTVKYDGYSRSDSNAVAVTYYHNSSDKNPALWLHELGHVLGLKHHSADPECTGEPCLMSKRGYIEGQKLCDHHIAQLQALAGTG